MVSQLLIYQRVRRCANLFWSDLAHPAEHTDLTAFFRRFQMALRLCGLALRGVTTEGSPRYPEPLPTVFGEVPHQLCAFPILQELPGNK